MDSDLFLVSRAEDSAYQPAIRLRGGKITIGRTPQCHIFLPDPTVSRQHAVLSVTADRILLTDLKSRNGTWVDEQRIESTTLKKGQEIRFGDTVFVLSGDPNKESAMELDLATDVPRTIRKTINPSESLKPRQLEVLSWLIQGMNEKEVAAQLGISRETVHNHIRRIYAAYNVHSRVELLLKVNPMKGIKLTLSRPDE
jgi:pSer/pThr/pTyr-binding forkhead associated (FHA) protein